MKESKLKKKTVKELKTKLRKAKQKSIFSKKLPWLSKKKTWLPGWGYKKLFAALEA